ncbi:MAG: thioredoxin [Candidatus Marinimicrobia bacterium]|nr:thioredoxin [Candidatus Neomarinimicrobiota bacterium]|tara:strand:- start:792 stop:1121 length:330 start_codon:yes stop_codon:yes gene_type:complete
MSNNIVLLNDDNFESFLSQDKPILVDFWAEWCGPCKMLNPVIEELSNDFADRAIIAKVNVDESPNIAQKYSVRSIPSLLFFSKGAVIEQLIGVSSKEDMASIIEKLINE